MNKLEHIPAERYEPRPAWFAEVVDCGGVAIKLSIIHAYGGDLSAAILNKARLVIQDTASAIAATDHDGAGFAILHEGTAGRWLLLHWWTRGGVATHMMWRADLTPDSDFEKVDPLTMACVWELSVIDFERRAWMATAMSGKSVAEYLALTYPRGSA
jgi:hypothetical protein